MQKKELLAKFNIMQEVMLATTDGERAYVRPVLMVYHQERFFICTGSADAKSAQLRKKPAAEFCYYLNEEGKGTYIRANGKVEFITDPATRAELMEIASYIKHYWTDPADEGFALLEVHADWFAFMEYNTSIEIRIENTE